MSTPYGDFNYNSTEYMTSPDFIDDRPMLSQSSSHSTQDNSARSTSMGSDYSNQMMGSLGQNQHYMHDHVMQPQMISSVSPQSSGWWPQNSMMGLDTSMNMMADMGLSQSPNASATTSPTLQDDYDSRPLSIGSNSEIVEWQDKARVEVSGAAFPFPQKTSMY